MKKSSLLVSDSSENDPIYYNLALNHGLDEKDASGFNSVANFTELNNNPILLNSGDYNISVMRACIPTGTIPIYIFPIKIGPLQTNINLGRNFFSFRYVSGLNSNGDFIYEDLADVNEYTLNVNFITENINLTPAGNSTYYSYPYPPSNYPSSGPKGQQDVSGYYYYIYNIESLLFMFNLTLKNLWSTYATAWNLLHTLNPFPLDISPFFSYDPISQLWTINVEKTYFNNNTMATAFTPFISINCDVLTIYNTFISNRYNPSAIPDINDNTASFMIMVNDTILNNFSLNSHTYLKMTADLSSISSLASLQKIVFEVSGDILVKNNEIESIASHFQKSNLTQISQQKPTISMLVDFEVNKEEWAKNRSFIQFQASSIEQVRLISLSKKAILQNFTLAIYWLDVYGNRHPLEVPNIGNPLTVKLAFFNKKFKK